MDVGKCRIIIVGANLRVRPVVKKNSENQDLQDWRDLHDLNINIEEQSAL